MPFICYFPRDGLKADLLVLSECIPDGDGWPDPNNLSDEACIVILDYSGDEWSQDETLTMLEEYPSNEIQNLDDFRLKILGVVATWDPDWLSYEVEDDPIKEMLYEAMVGFTANCMRRAHRLFCTFIPIVAMPSVPEPPPKNKGEPVTPPLIDWIRKLDCPGTDAAAELIQARDAFGYSKYKQHLMSGDGRKTAEEARQELGDFFQYWFKGRMNGEDMSSVRKLFPVLRAIMKDEGKMLKKRPKKKVKKKAKKEE